MLKSRTQDIWKRQRGQRLEWLATPTFEINTPGSSIPNGWLAWSEPPTILNPNVLLPFFKTISWKNKTKNMRMLQQNFPLPVIDLFLCNGQERNLKRVSQRLRQTWGPNNRDKLKNPPGKCSISRRSLPGRHVWVTSYFAQSLDNYSWLPIIRTFRKLEVIHFFSFRSFSLYVYPR